MEGAVLDHFKKVKPSTISMAHFHSLLSDESGQDNSTTATNILIFLQFFFKINDISILDNHMVTEYKDSLWNNSSV